MLNHEPMTHSETRQHSPPQLLSFRMANSSELSRLMRQARQQTFDLLEAFVTGLKGRVIDTTDYPEVNPPLWEFGHVAWFNEYWVERNPQRALGLAYQDGPSAHLPSRTHQVDQLYNSAVTAPETRWKIDLEPLSAVRRYLTDSHDACQARLNTASDQSESLYFYQLALAHEFMHIESFLMNAQAIGLRPPDWAAAQISDALDPFAHSPAERQIPETRVTSPPSEGVFQFDNECPGADWRVKPFSIDEHLVSHDQFAAFVDDHGYDRPEFWSEQGWRWRGQQASDGPRYWRSGPKGIERRWFGDWQTVCGQTPMIHVSLYEAEAWCHWAGRRLPAEAQWLAAAAAGIHWGAAWEWTSDRFLPFAGFSPHPYRDYSLPWFGDHQVLKGASWATNPSFRTPHYRNFFRPHRNDIPAGFRSVSIE